MNIKLLSFCYFGLGFVYRARGNDSSYTAKRINRAFSTHNGAGIENRATTYLNVITKECANLLSFSAIFLALVLCSDNYKRLIGLYVACNRACAHM